MKKYKLIKKYPSLHKTWEEGMIVGIEDNKFLYSPCSSKYYNIFLNTKNEVENNPEFWEQVIKYPIGTQATDTRIMDSLYTKEEDGWYKKAKTAYTDELITKRESIKILDKKIEKDYEILSFKNYNDEIWKLDSQLKDVYRNNNKTGLYNLTSMLNLPDAFKIHSVKRLSDNETFTIGDKTDLGTINHFTAYDYVMHCSCKHENAARYFSGNINKLKKVEKDYEILKLSYMNEIYDRFNGTYWFDEKATNIKDAIANRIHIDTVNSYGVKLHSIKRLSDSEVFTVGDKVVFQGNGFSEETIIFNFELIKSSLYAKSGSANFHIKWIKHIKKPLFTTLDNVGVYENDPVFEVMKSFHIFPYKSWQKHYGNKGVPAKGKLMFSERKNAEKYIRMNKRGLSINDVKRIFPTMQNIQLKKLIHLLENDEKI